MRIFENLAALPADIKGSILAIGNFDGVHRGHRALLAAAQRMAVAKGLAFGVLTFEPHPRTLFRPDDPPFRLTPPQKKFALLESCGVDFILSLPFDWDFASQSADDFVENILIKKLDPAHVLTGAEFRFGQLRKGSIDTIRAAGLKASAFETALDVNDEVFSSTSVRQALRTGDVLRANDILGWDWEIEGEIFRGDRRGHELGYPTANIRLGNLLHPAYGVWAAQVMIEGEDVWRMAATNIGIRPMFELKVGQVEAHILDFEDRDIYGKILRIRPIARLRGEAKFGSLEALVAQIEADCAQVRTLLQN